MVGVVVNDRGYMIKSGSDMIHFDKDFDGGAEGNFQCASK